MKEDIATRPNTLPWPPIIYLSLLLAALGLDAVWPLQPLPPAWATWARVAGAGIAVMGIGLDLAAMLAMRSARTNILPHRGADLLLTDGVFAFSRNPIYLGNTLLLLGGGMLLSSAWMIAGALAALLLVDRLAIRREERHLSARFGQAFADYAARTPRWIRWHR